MVKTILKIVFFIILLLIAIGLVMVYTIGEHKNKEILQAQISKVTGLEVVLGGAIDFNLFPLPHIHLEDVSLRADLKNNKELLFKFKKVSFSLPWKSFYQELKELKHIQAEDLTLNYFSHGKIEQSINFDKFKGNITSVNESLNISDFELTLGKNAIKGNLAFVFTNDKTTMKGDLALSSFNSFLSSKSFTGNNRTLLNKFLNEESLKSLEATLQVKIKQLALQDAVLQNVKLQVDLKNSMLIVTYQGKEGELSHKGKIVLQSKKNSPQLLASFNINDPKGIKTMEGMVGFLYEQENPLFTGKIKLKQWTLSLLNEDQTNLNFLKKIKDYEGDLAVEVADLTVDKFKLQNAHLFLKLKKNLMSADLKGTLEQGESINHITVNYNESAPNFSVSANVQLKNAKATEIIKLFDTRATILGGQLNFSFNGNSKGVNVANMLANLNGNATIYIKDLKLINQNIDSSKVDIFAAIFKSFNSKKSDTNLECIAIKLDFTNGIASANQSIAIETADLFALGAGSLNLRTQKLDFAFDLQPRSNLNVEIGSLDHVVYLKGTLANPQIETSAKGFIKEGGTLMLGLATGGMSLLAEKLYKVATKNSSPCKQVLGNVQ